MLLFFFVAIGMVPAPLAKIESEQLVLSGGEELEDTRNYIHVYIGKDGGGIVAQVGYDEAIPLEQLTAKLEDVRKEEPQRNIVVLRIDVDTPIGLVRNMIEPAILKANVKRIIFFLEDEEEVQSLKRTHRKLRAFRKRVRVLTLEDGPIL